MSGFKDISTTAKLISMAFAAVIGIFCFAFFFSVIESRAAFQLEKEKSVHHKIDEIEDSFIYLVIHDGDTLGAVAIPK